MYFRDIFGVDVERNRQISVPIKISGTRKAGGSSDGKVVDTNRWRGCRKRSV